MEPKFIRLYKYTSHQVFFLFFLPCKIYITTYKQFQVRKSSLHIPSPKCMRNLKDLSFTMNHDQIIDLRYQVIIKQPTFHNEHFPQQKQMKCKTTQHIPKPGYHRKKKILNLHSNRNPVEIDKRKANPERSGFCYTISQADAGFFGIDVEEDTLVANFGLGGQANQAAEVRICRPI